MYDIELVSICMGHAATVMLMTHYMFVGYLSIIEQIRVFRAGDRRTNSSLYLHVFLSLIRPCF